MNIENINFNNLDLTYEYIDDIVLLHVIGEVDLNSVKDFIKVLEKFRNEGKHQLIIECSNIRYIDSSGVGALLREKTKLTQIESYKKKDVVLLNQSESLKRVLELTRLLSLFQTFSDRDEAIKYFLDDD